MSAAWTWLDKAVDSLRVDLCQPGQHADFPDGQITDWRIVPFLVIAQSYVGRYTVRLRDGTTATCETGGAFITAAEIPHHILHRADAAGVLSARWLHVRVTLAGTVEASRLIRPPLTVDRRAFSAIEPVLLKLLDAKKPKDNPLAYAARRTRLALEVFEQVVRWSEPAPEAAVTMGGLARLAPVLDHIQNRLAQPMAIPELAQLADVSVPRFHAIFKRSIGLPPREYLLRERLTRARVMLSSSTTAIEAIAAACGFADPFHFSRIFRQRFGLSPSAWRQQQAYGRNNADQQ